MLSFGAGLYGRLSRLALKPDIRTPALIFRSAGYDSIQSPEAGRWSHALKGGEMSRVAIDIGGGFRTQEGTTDGQMSCRRRANDGDLCRCVEHVFEPSGVNPSDVGQLARANAVINTIPKRNAKTD
jgi:hypothetical protein